jgi:hypothetical protein
MPSDVSFRVINQAFHPGDVVLTTIKLRCQGISDGVSRIFSNTLTEPDKFAQTSNSPWFTEAGVLNDRLADDRKKKNVDRFLLVRKSTPAIIVDVSGLSGRGAAEERSGPASDDVVAPDEGRNIGGARWTTSTSPV